MADDAERVYTIPLGKVLLSPDNRRAMRAINMIREFARKHMKVQEIKIDQALSHEIWARGIRRPPRKVRVRMSKTEEGHVLVSPYSLGKGAAEPEGAADEATQPGDAAPADDVAPQAGDVGEAAEAEAGPAPKEGAPGPKAGRPGPKASPGPKPEPKKDAPGPKAGRPEPKESPAEAKPEPKAETKDAKPEPKKDAPKE